MIRILNTGAALVSFFLLGSVAPQVSTQALLDEIAHGNSASVAEQQLESQGAQDADVRKMLSERLPLLLSQRKELKMTQTKDMDRLMLFVKLTGTLKLVSTVPALSELLTNDGTKSLNTGFYRAAELLDDPVGAALARIGEPSVPEVSKLLQSPTPRIRSRAVYVLAKIGSPQALGAIRRAGEREKDPIMRSFMQANSTGQR